LSTTLDQEHEKERQLALMGGDSKELQLYKGKEQHLALPYLNQDLVSAEEAQEMSALKKRRERWSAVPKEDRRESIREYIKNTRAIFLAKIAMDDKRQEAERMQEYIKQKEAVLSLNKEIYEQDKKMVNEYVEFMRDKAEMQKAKADAANKERKEKEDKLERLMRERTELKKKFADSKEQCAQYKGYVDFMFTLNPQLEQEILERRKKRGNKFFVTEQKENDGKILNQNEPTDEELKELKRDFGITEYDSDTEYPPGFNSVDEFHELMQKQASDNLTLIQDVHKREESLERLQKETKTKVQEKEKELEKVKADLKGLDEKRKQKLARLNEILDMNEGRATTANTEQMMSMTTEERLKQADKYNELKKSIHTTIVGIRDILMPSGKTSKLKDSYGDSESEKNTLYILEYLTEYLRKLKMVRDWKYISASKKGSTKTLDDEESKLKTDMNQRRANAERDKMKEVIEKKRTNLIENWKHPRFRKDPKEMMKKKMLKEGKKKKEDGPKIKGTDEFDDKYFVE